MEEYSHLEDKELFDLIYKTDLATKLKSSEEWKLLKEAADRIIEDTVRKFALDVKVGKDSLEEILELQLIIRKYKFGLFREFDLLAKENKFLRGEAGERGILGRVASIFKKTAP